MRLQNRHPSRRKLVYLVMYIAFLLMLVETLSRVYISVKHQMSFFCPSRQVFYRFYPGLQAVKEAPQPAESKFTILLLGASVLIPEFGSIPGLLEKKLEERGITNFQIQNLSEKAHNSRDTYLKLTVLKDTPIDLVVVYHAINDLRANNCPPEIFKDDYSHFEWYELLQVTQRHQHTLQIMALPYFVDHLFHRAKQEFWTEDYMPFYDPRKSWVEYGRTIKTAAAFQSNFENIIQLASTTSKKAFLMTYANYIPEDYNLEAFKKRELDYQKHISPVETWGKLEYVKKGLAVHNRILRGFPETFPQIGFIDMEKQIPKEGAYFNDICHLSRKGCELFTEILSGSIARVYHQSLESKK